MPDASTILVLEGMGVPPYSARGLTQTLEPIAAAPDLRRTVNGTLINLSAAEFRKYRSSIRGNDQDPPAVEAVWPGKVLTVDCIVELAYESMTDGPARSVVSGSSRSADGFTFYRPQLTMMVVGFSVERDEWGAAVGWALELEEV